MSLYIVLPIHVYPDTWDLRCTCTVGVFAWCIQYRYNFTFGPLTTYLVDVSPDNFSEVVASTLTDIVIIICLTEGIVVLTYV